MATFEIEELREEIKDMESIEEILEHLKSANSTLGDYLYEKLEVKMQETEIENLTL